MALAAEPMWQLTVHACAFHQSEWSSERSPRLGVQVPAAVLPTLVLRCLASAQGAEASPRSELGEMSTDAKSYLLRFATFHDLALWAQHPTVGAHCTCECFVGPRDDERGALLGRVHHVGVGG